MLTMNLNWWTLGFSASHSYIADTSPNQAEETLTCTVHACTYVQLGTIFLLQERWPTIQAYNPAFVTCNTKGKAWWMSGGVATSWKIKAVLYLVLSQTSSREYIASSRVTTLQLKQLICFYSDVLQDLPSF